MATCFVVASVGKKTYRRKFNVDLVPREGQSVRLCDEIAPVAVKSVVHCLELRCVEILVDVDVKLEKEFENGDWKKA